MKIFNIDTLNISNTNKDELNNKWEYLSSDENNRSIWIHYLKDCKFTGHNLYYPNVLIYSNNDEKLYLPYNERTMSMKTTTIYEKMNMDFEYNHLDNINNENDNNKNNENEHNIIENGFFFVYNTDNYYHFIYDTLPFLITYKHLKQKNPDLKLLMNYPNANMKIFYKFILETLEILELEDKIIIIDNNTKCKNLYLSTSYTHDIDSNLPPRREIYSLYTDMVNKIINEFNNINDIDKIPKKLYISRRTWIHNDMSNIGTNYTTRRKMTNEDQLVQKLVSEGYKEIFTENMSMRDKIIYFNNASHIIGAIGGGICNVVFSKPIITKLIALISPTFLDVNKRFKYSLECVNVMYYDKCYHTENDEFKKYMRVRHNEKNIYGEIVEIEGEMLKISYTDGSNTGWNFNSKYDFIFIAKEDVIKLDDGLNSNWCVELDNLKLLL